MAASNSTENRMSGHLRASLAEDAHTLTPISLFPYFSNNPSPLMSYTNHKIPATEKASAKQPEGSWVSALHIAVQRGHIRIVRVLLQHGVDCNQKDGAGLTPLIHSIIGDHEDVTSSLIQNGARISETDNHGRNAVHWAVLQRREALLGVLLEHCSGDQKVMESHDLDGKTPLHTAVDIGFEAGVCILLEHGADPSSRAEIY